MTNCLLCSSVISEKRLKKLQLHSTKPVVTDLESLAGGLATRSIFPSEYVLSLRGVVKPILKLREHAEMEKLGGAAHTSIQRSSI